MLEVRLERYASWLSEYISKYWKSGHSDSKLCSVSTYLSGPICVTVTFSKGDTFEKVFKGLQQIYY